MTEKAEMKFDTPARVAFDLMKFIASHENKSDTERETREYWLTLFHQSMKAAKGHDKLEFILKKE